MRMRALLMLMSAHVCERCSWRPWSRLTRARRRRANEAACACRVYLGWSVRWGFSAVRTDAHSSDRGALEYKTREARRRAGSCPNGTGCAQLSRPLRVCCRPPCQSVARTYKTLPTSSVILSPRRRCAAPRARGAAHNYDWFVNVRPRAFFCDTPREPSLAWDNNT